MCERCLGIVYGISLSFFEITKGCKGPDLVNTFEAPKMIQKVLEYVRESTLAIWESCKPQKSLIDTLKKNHENIN